MQSCDEKEVFFKAFIYLVFTKLWNVLIQSTHVHMVLKSEAFSIFIESADFRYCKITYFFSNRKISMNIHAYCDTFLCWTFLYIISAGVRVA